jgi:hypothetical protein
MAIHHAVVRREAYLPTVQAGSIHLLLFAEKVMNIKKFVDALALADTHGLDATDLIILYDVGVAAEGEGTIMKIACKPSIMSKATRHERIKKLYKRRFLIKKEDPNNMRRKTLELSDASMEFFKQFEKVWG